MIFVELSIIFTFEQNKKRSHCQTWQTAKFGCLLGLANPLMIIGKNLPRGTECDISSIVGSLTVDCVKAKPTDWGACLLRPTYMYAIMMYGAQSL
jgi:hypothetical protein